jgi:hypothetical protein
MPRHPTKVATQAVELAFSAPQVIAHRVSRIMLAGANPSSQDRHEFRLMGVEKLAAFNESWTAMAVQSFVAQQQFAASLWRTWVRMCFGGTPSLSQHSSQWQSAALALIAEGMAPVHRRAVANAKRLSIKSH